MNGCAPGLALIERLKATRKWAIEVGNERFDMQGNELASGTHFHMNGLVPGIFLKQRKMAIANDFC